MTRAAARTTTGASSRAATRATNRLEVLERAASAIAEHGYHGMSMRDLARATGRGLASFYSLFASKEDILFELQERAFEGLLASAEHAVAQTKVPEDRLYLFIANHVRYVVDQPDVMRVLVQEGASLPPERRAAIRALKQRYFALGQKLVRTVVARRSAARGGRHTPDALELERATYCVFGMLNWIYGWYDVQRHGSAEDVARTIWRAALSGVISACFPEHARKDSYAPLATTELTALLETKDEPE